MQVDRSGDVIEFYNIVFIPSVKGFLLQLSQRRIPTISPKLPQLGGMFPAQKMFGGRWYNNTANPSKGLKLCTMIEGLAPCDSGEAVLGHQSQKHLAHHLASV